jgi:PAS domain S-box-containing protein
VQREAEPEVTISKRAKEKQPYEFEGLLVDILARFVNLPAEQVDQEIEDAISRVCEFLEFDRTGIWRRCQEDLGPLALRQKCLRPRQIALGSIAAGDEVREAGISELAGEDSLPVGTELREIFPWVSEQVLRGKAVLVSRLMDLPPEAARDKEKMLTIGTRSCALIPYKVEGEVLGAVSFELVREEGTWPEALVRRLEFVAEVFAQATARRLSDERLRASEAHLSLAAASADAALWSLHLGTGKIQTTAKGFELLELPVDAELTFLAFLAMVHPEDRDNVRRATEEAISFGRELNLEYRLVLGGGETWWVSSLGRCHYNGAGTPEQLMGVSTNITERKRAESLLRESESRFRTVADSAPVLIWMSGPDKLCNFFNKPWLDFTGRTLEQELGKGWAEGVHPEDIQQCLGTYEAAFEARIPFVLEYRVRRHDGEYRWLLGKGVPRHDPRGSFTGYIGSCVDVTEQKLAREALAKSYVEIQELKDRLQAESEYLKTEIKTGHPHAQIIGRSPRIRQVLRQVEQVAPVNCAVLITGETGTGKELIAQEIHRLSARRKRMMVLVNCAALPSALVESELFGRERGAYTGALTSQVGRFEVANGSTIFLDEVGELSMEVQAKLLRVLQEGEFQRLGSPKTHKVDVRIIAATNRDLAAAVRTGRFREDLYYRLRVFPVDLPPLRDRVGDIPLLAFAFMEEFSSRMGKKITKVSRRSMESLQQHSWPGNIRELRNVIEHSVIVTTGEMLNLSFLGDSPTRNIQPMTLAEAEREHILKTLESTGWRIKGPHGAAKRLDLQPSTLYSRMQKLGIPHRRQKDDNATKGRPVVRDNELLSKRALIC